MKKKKPKEGTTTKLKNETINMGIGELARAYFPRKFRWVAGADHGLEKHFKTFDYNLIDKKIEFTMIEYFMGDEKECPVHRWILNKIYQENKEDITISTYNGCGIKMYDCIFKEVILTSHRTDYDYAESNIVTHHLWGTFKSVEKILNVEEVEESRC